MWLKNKYQDILAGRMEADQIAESEKWFEETSPPFDNKKERVYKIGHNIYVTYYLSRHKDAFWKLFIGKKRKGTLTKDFHTKIGE